MERTKQLMINVYNNNGQLLDQIVKRVFLNELNDFHLPPLILMENRHVEIFLAYNGREL